MTCKDFLSYVAPPLVLSKNQIRALESIMDTFVPELSPEDEEDLVGQRQDTVDEKTIRTYCQETGGDYVQAAISMVTKQYSPKQQQEFSLLLNLLSSPEGLQSLTGQSEQLDTLSVQKRQEIVLDWRQSPLADQRAIYNTFRTLSLLTVYTNMTKSTKQAIQYDQEEKIFDSNQKALPMLQDIPEDSYFDTIVIGSGAGGGVVASELSKSGQTVLVIEKGKYFHDNDFQTNESFGLNNLYAFGGLCSDVDNSIGILAASTFGGGTTINWAVSLRTPTVVTDEWASLGLTYFSSPEFSKKLDKVEERIGVSIKNITNGCSGDMMMKGCRKLGIHVELAPQNSGGKKHACGACFLGCRSGVKNGANNTWHQDSLENGAQFLDQTKVNRVIIENGKAAGVECELRNGKKICIRSGCVVVSAGSLESPGILLRSGLKNPEIGKNLRLHPLSFLIAQYKEPVSTFQGDLVSMYSLAAHNTDRSVHGSYLESLFLIPLYFSIFVPWLSGKDHKKNMLNINKTAGIMVIDHDADSKGLVQYDDSGNPLVKFSLSESDAGSMAEGIQQSADIMVASGARKLFSTQIYFAPFEFRENEESDVKNPRYLEWREKIKTHGINKGDASIMTAHQMGSNRMGVSSDTSVVKPTGETWEVENLFVADASVFPTSSGVNPMVTIEAVALYISECILKKKNSQ